MLSKHSTSKVDPQTQKLGYKSIVKMVIILLSGKSYVNILISIK